MPWWEDDAVFAQRKKRQDEQERGEQFSEEEAFRATAYTRDDLSMVVSYLSSLNRQISVIKNILIFFCVLVLLGPIVIILGWIWEISRH